MMSSGPQNFDSAISIDVPAVLLVLRKMNLCLWETIMAVFLTCPQKGTRAAAAGWRTRGDARTFFRHKRGRNVSPESPRAARLGSRGGLLAPAQPANQIA